MQLIIIVLQFFLPIRKTPFTVSYKKKSFFFVNIYVVNIYVVQIYAAEVVHSTKEFVSSPVMFSPMSIIHDDHMTAHCPVQSEGVIKKANGH